MKQEKDSPFDAIDQLVESHKELHNDHLIILKRIDEVYTLEKLIYKGVQDLIGSGNGSITPELEAIIKTVSARALLIDRKVPDKNVPPGTGNP